MLNRITWRRLTFSLSTRFKCKKCPILKLNPGATSQYMLNTPQQIAFFFIADQWCNGWFSLKAGSTDVVEHKRAKPFPLYCISYYVAVSDYFSFHTIQLPKMSLFTIESRCNVNIMRSIMPCHTSLNHGCSMRLWVIPCDFQKCGGSYKQFLSCGSNSSRRSN